MLAANCHQIVVRGLLLLALLPTAYHASAAEFSLGSPLKDIDPVFSRAINSVLDHHIDSRKGYYSNDGIIEAYTGETGKSTEGVADGNCYQQANDLPFELYSAYKGGIVDRTYLCYDGHNGYDFSVSGVDVLAAEAGKLTTFGGCPLQGSMASDCNHGNGNYAEIVHDNGLKTIYAHMASFSSDCAVNGRVEKGCKIGVSGNSGRSSAPHLHFGLKDSSGRILDPFSFWTNKGIDVYFEGKVTFIGNGIDPANGIIKVGDKFSGIYQVDPNIFDYHSSSKIGNYRIKSVDLRIGSHLLADDGFYGIGVDNGILLGVYNNTYDSFTRKYSDQFSFASKLTSDIKIGNWSPYAMIFTFDDSTGKALKNDKNPVLTKAPDPGSFTTTVVSILFRNSVDSSLARAVTATIEYHVVFK